MSSILSGKFDDKSASYLDKMFMVQFSNEPIMFKENGKIDMKNSDNRNTLIGMYAIVYRGTGQTFKKSLIDKKNLVDTNQPLPEGNTTVGVNKAYYYFVDDGTGIGISKIERLILENDSLVAFFLGNPPSPTSGPITKSENKNININLLTNNLYEKYMLLYPSGKKNNNMMIVGGIVGAIVLMIILYFFVFKKKSSSGFGSNFGRTVRRLKFSFGGGSKRR